MCSEPQPNKANRRVLLAVREAIPSHQLSVEVGHVNFCVCSPGYNTYAAEFDLLIMAFDPTTEKEQRWYHLELLPKLKSDAKIIWTT